MIPCCEKLLATFKMFVDSRNYSKILRTRCICMFENAPFVMYRLRGKNTCEYDTYPQLEGTVLVPGLVTHFLLVRLFLIP